MLKYKVYGERGRLSDSCLGCRTSNEVASQEETRLIILRKIVVQKAMAFGVPSSESLRRPLESLTHQLLNLDKQRAIDNKTNGCSD